MEKELKLEEAETEKTFYIGVIYYEGKKPYPTLYETREACGDSNEIYIVKIPYKK